MSHVMIDLETLGTVADAAIASVGAVLFDPKTDWIGDHLHVHIDLDSCVFHGLHIDPATVIWWLGQSDEARKTLIAGQVRAAPLPEALSAIARFIPPDSTVWCNGASFDFPILASAYRAIKKPAPWKFWREMDLRTLKGINPGMKLAREGVHHNALDDARHQARLVQRILQANPDMDS
jgi:hypothetical protein